MIDMKISTVSQYNYYNYAYNVKKYQGNNSNIVFGADIFNKKALKVAQEKVKNLETKNSILEKQNKIFEELLNKIQIPGYATKEAVDNLIKDLKTQFLPIQEVSTDLLDYKKYIAQKLESTLNYDPMDPVFNPVEEKTPYSFSKIFEYKESDAPTSAQKAVSTELLMNKLLKNNVLIIDFNSEESKIIKNSNAYITGEEFGISEKIPTDMTKKYGKRVGWSDEKIARDLLQNFYDAHGHTLEGTKIEIKKHGKKYKIKISGLTEYEYKNIQYIGAGDKDNDLYNAGGFGEGTKILSAVLLANEKTEKVTFSSANWNIDYSLSHDQDDAIIMREFNKIEPPTKGNFVEFETTDSNLVKKIIEARNYFYHPENPDFKDLTFENEHWGFKILPKGENGNLYMTQRFEYESNDSWNNPLKEIILIFKRRSHDPMLLGKNRDRISLRLKEIKEIIQKDFIETMTDKELAKAILDFEPVWNTKYDRNTQLNVAYELFKCMAKEASSRNIYFDLKDKKYASRFCSINQDIVNRVHKLGYEIVDSEMYHLGIDSVNNIYKRTRKHEPIEPNKTEKKKLILLEEGITLLAEDNAMKQRIDSKEAQSPRFIFDAKKAKEANLIAESVVENKTYKGHWIDRESLNNKPFYELLAVWLHEITHKYAGDGTSDFGYKLTDVMGLELESLMNEPQRLEKLRYLRSIFEKL